MGEFVIYRHGKNPSNQMNSDRVPVAAVEAESDAHAIDLVTGASYPTILEGQYLSAVPRSESTIEDWEVAAAMEIMEAVILQHY
ncbi:MAG: hypothetical protein RDU20_16020 [Desulfomonilaceae bacterium]|nr:hypothetical protein [Desulfomonilaceae bacterium]